MKHTSNNIIMYKGRYIRRFCLCRGYPSCYIVTWAADQGESQSFYGSLAELMEKIDDTIRFFGKWEFLI
jgi:ssDNA-binding Zn-finger/Zn-ribbon topoisomerase 1